MAQPAFPMAVRISGGLMIIASLWNILFALTFMVSWIASLVFACLAVLYIPMLLLFGYNAFVGLRLMLGQRVDNAEWVPLASSGLGLFFLCGLAAVVPDGAAALLLFVNRDALEEYDEAMARLEMY